MAAPETKGPQSRPAQSFIWRIEYVLVCPVYRLYTFLQRLLNASISTVLRVMRFLMAIIQTVSNVFGHAAMLIAFTSDCARRVRNFDYSGFVVWLSTLPRTYYGKCKVSIKKTLWEPIFGTVSNAALRISRYFKAQLREYMIYLRGFAELCRRLFLLTSDFVPGGQITVTAFLLFLAVIFIVKLFSFIQLFLQLVEFAYGVIVFLFHPLVLTMQDIMAVLDPIVQLIYLLARIVLYAIISALQAVAMFIWLNLISITSGLYKCWQRFLSSKVMKIVSSLLAKTFHIFLEKFVYVFLPFMTRTTCVALNFLFDIFCVAYKNFFVITICNEKLENLTASRIASLTFIFWALILAFRVRKRFSEKARSEVDDSYPDAIASNVGGTQSEANKTDLQKIRTSASRRTTMYDSSRKVTRGHEDTVRYRGKADGDGERENFADDPSVGHIHFSALAHICTDFIKGSCQKGKECDNHHCALPYHWQYRPSLEGWISFVAEDNERIECLFCDPNNNVVTINEIYVVLKSYRTRTTTSSSIEPVKLDFENMRLEKSYQRADLRRLSTESKVKENESTFATQWLWYKEMDSGKWIKYGEQGELSDVAQEDIESAFLRREREYTYTKDNQEFRLHFLMTPMCERSFRPYSKKVVRRRPLFRSAEVVKKVKEAANPSNRLSIRRFFSWL